MIVEDENLSLKDYLANCLFNAEFVEDAIECIPKDAIVVNFSSNKFFEKLKENLKGESVSIAMVKDDFFIFNDFIISLGE